MSEGCMKFLVRLGKAFVIEILRVLPVPRRMMYAVNEHDDRRSFGYIDISSTVIGESHPVDHPKRRIQAQSLQDYLSRKLELRNICITQRLFAEHRIELLPHFVDTVRTLAQQVEQPR